MQSNNMRPMNIRPCLQPMAVAPRGQSVTGIIGQPLINRMSGPVGLARPVGPAHIVMGAVGCVGPPQARGQVMQQKAPNVVSGLYPPPVYQLGTLPGHQATTGKLLQSGPHTGIPTCMGRQSRMTNVHGMAFRQTLVSPIQPATAGYTVRGIHPATVTSGHQPRPAMIQPRHIGLNYGPPRQLRLPTEQTKHQYMITGGNITPVAPVSIMSPRIIRSPASLVGISPPADNVTVTQFSPRFLSAQPISSPASPLVPLNPGMFQVGRTPGQPQFYSSPVNPSSKPQFYQSPVNPSSKPQFYSSQVNPSSMQPAVFAFSNTTTMAVATTSSPLALGSMSITPPQGSVIYTPPADRLGSMILMQNPAGSAGSADQPTDLSTKSTPEKSDTDHDKSDVEDAPDVDLQKSNSKSDLQKSNSTSDLQKSNSTSDLQKSNCKSHLEKSSSKSDVEKFSSKSEVDDTAGEVEEEATDESLKNFHETYLNLKQRTVVVGDETNSESSNEAVCFQENYLNLRQKQVVSSIGDGASAGNTQVESTVRPKEMTMWGDADKHGSGTSTSNPGNKCEIDTGDYTEGGVPVDHDDAEFVWEDYLQATGAKAVPPTAFQHVECSLQSGFVKGMKLEVPTNCGAAESYWVASVVLTCGPLLRLRYEGYEEDSNADFWCDVSTAEIHAIGWCAENGQNLQPPEGIKDKVSDWRVFLMTTLTGARTAPFYLLDRETGSTPIDQLKSGMRLELQDEMKPIQVWLVKVVENIGGRLYLRYEGAESALHDFWMFYLDNHLHPIGWANDEGCTYQHPACIRSEHSEEEWREILKTALAECDDQLLPVDVFKDQMELEPHRFTVGMKLEAINPASKTLVYPATVVKVINSMYFLVEIDDLREASERQSIQICCHASFLGIFPTSWCQCKGFRLQHPPGWSRCDFMWPEYLSFCDAKAAPEKIFPAYDEDHGFERGMKLEAVNPDNGNQICAATITKITGPLLWVHLDNTPGTPSHIEDINSFNLFPVGWCESNGYQLKPPRKGGLFKYQHRRSSALLQPSLNGDAMQSDTYSCVKYGDASTEWCPKIYFNHRCFSGPYLSKGRIAELPKCVGPGPITLMMKEVLSLLISVAYKSSRVLKELQLDGPPNPSMQQQVLKAKYKGKSYRAVVELCRCEAQLDEFCRNVCIKLECCPFLFSPLFVEDDCPENCQQLTKTKYNYNYGKKKKVVGRPPGGHTNLDNSGKLPAKRGRKKRFHLIQKKGHTASSLTATGGQGQDRGNNGEVGDEGFIDDDRSFLNDDDESPSKKRRYIHHLPPPSDIQTRAAIGNKPKYSFERRTHKKILLSHSIPPQKAKHTEKSLLPPYLGRGASVLPRIEPVHVQSNPLHWSVLEVVQFMKSTDLGHLSRIMQEQEIDGQALLLLSLPVIQDHLELKLGPAVKLCHQIERLKITFFEKYA